MLLIAREALLVQRRDARVVIVGLRSRSLGHEDHADVPVSHGSTEGAVRPPRRQDEADRKRFKALKATALYDDKPMPEAAPKAAAAAVASAGSGPSARQHEAVDGASAEAHAEAAATDGGAEHARRQALRGRTDLNDTTEVELHGALDVTDRHPQWNGSMADHVSLS